MVKRDEEFAPIKNPEGVNEDSPNTARQLLYNLSKKWIEQAGGKLQGT